MAGGASVTTYSPGTTFWRDGGGVARRSVAGGGGSPPAGVEAQPGPPAATPERAARRSSVRTYCTVAESPVGAWTQASAAMASTALPVLVLPSSAGMARPDAPMAFSASA